MNRRQKKKAFKKRFGLNPTRGISIRTATRIMEHKETIERLKAAILDLWERGKQSASKLAEALLLLRQQEREAKRIESNFNIHNCDRR